MSVYTHLDLADLANLLSRYNLGAPRELTGIAEGVDNTNYRLITETGAYILTIVEDDDQARDLDHLIALIDHLAARGIPAPRPIHDREGGCRQEIQGKPALIVTCLQGSWPHAPEPPHCRQVGAALADIHLAGADFSINRLNPIGPEALPGLIDRLEGPAARAHPDLVDQLREEGRFLEATFLPLKLPRGVIHADLFPDNTLFAHGRLMGVLDFHYACADRLVYDLAIAVNAWCFDEAGRFLAPNQEALLDGYQQKRPLTDEERRAMGGALRAAALRFLLSRLRDRLFPRQGAQVTRKPPEPFLARLLHWRRTS